MTRLGDTTATLALLTMATALAPEPWGARHTRRGTKPKRQGRRTGRERMAKASRSRNRRRR